MGFLDGIEGTLGAVVGQAMQQGGAAALGPALEQTHFGGLAGLLTQLQQGGLANEVASWCGGEHIPVSADQIEAALGDSHLQQLAESLHLPTDQVSAFLAQHLPAATAAEQPSS